MIKNNKNEIAHKILLPKQLSLHRFYNVDQDNMSDF